MVSLLGSLGSLSRTWTKNQGAVDGSNLPLTRCSRQQRPPLPFQWAAGRKAARPSLASSSRSLQKVRASGSPPLSRSPSRPCTHIARPQAAPRELGVELVREVPHTFQELDLIHSCLRVMPCALNHFQGHEALAPVTPRPVSATSLS